MRLVWKDNEDYINFETGGNPYEFHAKQCDTENKFNDWVYQLSAKNWWTDEHEHQLREVALPKQDAA